MVKFYFIALSLFSVSAYAQLQWYNQTEKQLEIDMDQFIGIDRFENLFYIKNQTLFLKKNDQTLNYANLQLSSIDKVEIFNNLKLGVLHKNFNSVVMLDNRLSEIAIIDFNKINPIRTVSNITYASENNFWLFNTLTLELELFNYDTQKTIQKTLPIGEQIIALQSDYNNVFALTPTALFHYNYMGSLVSKTDHIGLENFKLWGDYLIFQKENNLYFKNISDSEIKDLGISKKTIKQFFVMNQTLYIYDGEILHQYQLLKD